MAGDMAQRHGSEGHWCDILDYHARSAGLLCLVRAPEGGVEKARLRRRWKRSLAAVVAVVDADAAVSQS